jgi:hypothetical protein
VIGKCIHNTGASLGAPSRGHFYSTRTAFDLHVGSEYVAVGMGLWETTLVALMCDDTGKPNWLPIGLFEFEPQLVPAHWEFALCDGRAASGGDALNRWVARWGYPELVRNEGHSDGLIERDPDALQIFFRELSRSEKEG